MLRQIESRHSAVSAVAAQQAVEARDRARRLLRAERKALLRRLGEVETRLEQLAPPLPPRAAGEPRRLVLEALESAPSPLPSWRVAQLSGLGVTHVNKHLVTMASEGVIGATGKGKGRRYFARTNEPEIV